MFGRIGVGIGPGKIVPGILERLFHFLGVQYSPFIFRAGLRIGNEPLTSSECRVTVSKEQGGSKQAGLPAREFRKNHKLGGE